MSERLTVMAQLPDFPRSFLEKFILLYKDLPCLWDRNCPTYKHRATRHKAVSKLTELLQQHFPSATRVHVMRKLESLRSCVRRELKRVIESRAKATHPDEVYSPNLWYYDLCLFMFGEDLNNYRPRRGASGHGQKAESEEDSIEYQEEDDGMPFVQSMESYSTDYKVSTSVVEVANESGHKRHLGYEDEATTSKRHCTEIEDEYDAVGVNVAAKLRGLPPNMRILAEKLVNDVLYQAQMNCLTPNTVISTPDPFKQDV